MTTEEIHAVESYTGYFSEQINATLRGTVEDGRVMTPGLNKTIAHMDSAFGASVPLSREAVVFRGIDYTVHLPDKAGATFKDKGFTSTTLDAKVAGSSFAGAHGTIAWIRLPKGARVLNVAGRGLAQFKKEKEVLLPRGSRFRITGKTVQPRTGKTILKMELVA